MRPDFYIVWQFLKGILIEKGFSGNIKWLFRENLIVRKDNIGNHQIFVDPELNEPGKRVKSIYDKLKKDNREIFFYTFLRNKDCTYVTIAEGSDMKVEKGDVVKKDWNLRFGFSKCLQVGKDEIELVEENEWSGLKQNEVIYFEPFSNFFWALSDYFK